MNGEEAEPVQITSYFIDNYLKFKADRMALASRMESMIPYVASRLLKAKYFRIFFFSQEFFLCSQVFLAFPKKSPGTRENFQKPLKQYFS